MRVNGISRRARDIRNDKAVLTDYFVDYRGLARVRLSDNGNLYAVVLLVLAHSIGNVFEHLVKQVARSASVYRGNGDRLAIKAKLVELVKFKRRSANGIALVYTRDDRLSALFEHDGYVAVVRGKTCANVTHKYDNVSAFDSDLCLKTHLL